MSEINIAAKRILFWCDRRVYSLDKNIKDLISDLPNIAVNPDVYRQISFLLDDLRNVEQRMGLIKRLSHEHDVS